MTNSSNENLVSVIIPCFNCENTVEATIESVIRQNDCKIEIICVDDCSTDQTADILFLLQERCAAVRVIRNNRNLGAAKSRNIGISESKGTFIAFLDSDDIWLDGKLAHQLALMKRYEADWSSTAFNIVRQGLVVGCVKPYERISPERLVFNNRIGTSSVLVRKCKLPASGFPNIRRGQDLALWLKLARGKARYVSTNEIFLDYKIGVSSISSNKLISMFYVLRATFYDSSLKDAHLIFFYLGYLFNGLYKHVRWRWGRGGVRQ